MRFTWKFWTWRRYKHRPFGFDPANDPQKCPHCERWYRGYDKHNLSECQLREAYNGPWPNHVEESSEGTMTRVTRSETAQVNSDLREAIRKAQGKNLTGSEVERMILAMPEPYHPFPCEDPPEPSGHNQAIKYLRSLMCTRVGPKIVNDEILKPFGYEMKRSDEQPPEPKDECTCPRGWGFHRTDGYIGWHHSECTLFPQNWNAPQWVKIDDRSYRPGDY